MENASLVLCPDDPRWAPADSDSLVALLLSIQLIGRPMERPMLFLTGSGFLDLVAFMGCAPDIRLEPGDDNQPFCHVHLLTKTDTVEFHCGKHTHKPRCPQCRTPVNDWKHKISQWLEYPIESAWRCTNCQHRASPWEYNWRRSAGFARCFIEISNIYPKEAIPQQQLLDTLESHYGVRWHFFYQY
ncbi:MAG: hypothetical protein PVG12_12270 [Gammaproteobacteria bacterium]|jgi:hypothetical protein